MNVVRSQRCGTLHIHILILLRVHTRIAGVDAKMQTLANEIVDSISSISEKYHPENVSFIEHPLDVFLQLICPIVNKPKTIESKMVVSSLTHNQLAHDSCIARLSKLCKSVSTRHRALTTRYNNAKLSHHFN